MTYNGNTYYYALNLQGDVMALLDANGNEVVSYHYNAWGEIISTTASTTGMLNTLAKYNPLRYRGYVYDRETGLYYLQSRYYNPEICRFISADDLDYLGADGSPISYNLYAYCLNNPINMSDETGSWPDWATKLAIGVGVIVLGSVVVAATAATGGAVAAFGSAIVAGLKTAAISGLVSAETSAAFAVAESIASGDNAQTTIERTVSAAVDGFANGFMWGAISFGVPRAAGYVTSKTGIFKRDITYGKNNFLYGTNELTIWRHGPNFRIDASATRGLHYHLRTATTGIGKHRTEWIPQIIGGVSGLITAFNG